MTTSLEIPRAIQFYSDYGRPEVEKLARAICLKRGFDPEMLVDDNGYADSPKVPLWWKYQDDAISLLALKDTL